MSDKLKITLRRCGWLLALLCFIFVPRIIYNLQPELDIVESSVYIENYYSSLNETAVSIEVTFNKSVSSGYITISYYDASDNFLQSKRSYLFSYNKTAKDSYETIKGKVDSYEITSFEFEPDDGFTMRVVKYSGIFISAIMLLAAIMLSYKEREVNGQLVAAYAGYYHHKLYVNGILYDEHNTFMSWTPIYLSTTLDDGTNIDATISLTNRISIKANNRLV